MKSTPLTILAVATLTVSMLPSLQAEPKSSSKTVGKLELYAVDGDGKALPYLTAGQYVALLVTADTAMFPDKAAAGLSVRASFSTLVLGKTVSYSFNVPVVSAKASKLVDPSVGLPTSGEKLGEDLQERSWEERIDFYVPAEVPEGALSITVRAKASSSETIARTYKFKVVRP